MDAVAVGEVDRSGAVYRLLTSGTLPRDGEEAPPVVSRAVMRFGRDLGSLIGLRQGCLIVLSPAQSLAAYFPKFRTVPAAQTVNFLNLVFCAASRG